MVTIIADTDMMSQAATRMQQQAQELESALGLLTSAAGRLNYWEGASYYQFTDLWQQACGQLRTLAQQGQHLGSRLQATATAFEQTDEQQAALAANVATAGDTGAVLGASTSRSGDNPLGVVAMSAFTLLMKELVQTDQQVNAHPQREALFAILGLLADKLGVDANYLMDAIRAGKIDPQVLEDTFKSELIDFAAFGLVSGYTDLALFDKLLVGVTPLTMGTPVGDEGDERMQQNNADIDAIRHKLGMVQENGRWVLHGYPPQ